MTQSDVILAQLDKVRSAGRDQWMACCPAHEDRNPSLSIKVGNDGRVLINCFAGCTALDILHSMGLELTDLYPEGALDHFKPPAAWARKEQAIKDRTREQDRKDRLHLDIVDSARQAGHHLKQEELDSEQAAWLRVHGQ